MRPQKLFPTSTPLSQAIFSGLYTIRSAEEWSLYGPVIVSRECSIYRAEAHTSQLVLAVKHYSATTNSVAPKQQFEAFQRYQNDMAAGCSIYKVPQTYHLDRTENLLYCEWISGQKLHEHLWSLRKKRLLSNDLEQTGTWLRHFHDAGKTEQTTVTFSKNLNTVKTQLARQKKRARNSLVFNQAYKMLQKLISRNSKIQGLQVQLHGDFTPPNLILNNGKVTGLDIWATKQGSAYNDIARMITYLAIAYPLFTNSPVFDAKGQLNNRLHPLFKGYGVDRVDFTAIEFRIILLAELLRRWLVIGGRASSFPGCITDLYQLIKINQQLKSLTATFPD